MDISEIAPFSGLEGSLGRPRSDVTAESALVLGSLVAFCVPSGIGPPYRGTRLSKLWASSPHAMTWLGKPLSLRLGGPGWSHSIYVRTSWLGSVRTSRL